MNYGSRRSTSWRTFPDSVGAVGSFTGSLETTVVVAEKNKEALEQLGFTYVYEGTYNPQGEQTLAAVPRSRCKAQAYADSAGSASR